MGIEEHIVSAVTILLVSFTFYSEAFIPGGCIPLPRDRWYRGFQGNRGPRGPRGLEGDAGEDIYLTTDGTAYYAQRGVHGLPGLDGRKGLRGDMGMDGLLGRPGDTGQKGDPCLDSCNYRTVNDHSKRGPNGPVGPLGPPGMRGVNGLKGMDGEAGLPGLPGLQGMPGDDTEMELGPVPMFSTVSAMQHASGLLSTTEPAIADLAFVTDESAFYIKVHDNAWKRLAYTEA